MLVLLLVPALTTPTGVTARLKLYLSATLHARDIHPLDVLCEHHFVVALSLYQHSVVYLQALAKFLFLRTPYRVNLKQDPHFISKQQQLRAKLHDKTDEIVIQDSASVNLSLQFRLGLQFQPDIFHRLSIPSDNFSSDDMGLTNRLRTYRTSRQK